MGPQFSCKKNHTGPGVELSPEQTLKGSLDEKLLRVINILHIFILNMQIIYTCVYIYICSICIYIYINYIYRNL